MSFFYVLARLSLFTLHLLVRYFAWRAGARRERETLAVTQALDAWTAPGTPDSASQLAFSAMSVRWALADQRQQDAELRWLSWQNRSERLSWLRAGLARWGGASLVYLVSEVGGLAYLHWDFVREVYEQVRYYHGG